MTGVIQRYLAEKRYGFIAPEEGGDQVFFHQSVFAPDGGPPPITGEVVEYTLGHDARAEAVYRTAEPMHHTGVLKSYDPVKGYGFLTADGSQYYLHKSEVIGGMIPAVGSRMDFYTTGNPVPGKSPRACYVAVLQ